MSYCVPKATPYCAREGYWYVANYTFCVAAGGTTYKKCTPDSWGTAISCPNTSLRGCTPAGWYTTAGYFNADSCSDESAGHSCNTDTACKECKATHRIAIMTYYTSNYNFNATAKTCVTSCLAKTGIDHTLCAQETKSGSHFCAEATIYKTTTKVGICVEKFGTGKDCTENYQCVSGICKLGKCAGI